MKITVQDYLLASWSVTVCIQVKCHRFVLHFCHNVLFIGDRSLFFKKTLSTLYTTARKGYAALQAECGKAMTTTLTAYPQLPALADKTVLKLLPQDTYSKTLLPADSQALQPLKCYGDGNCLFRYNYCHHNYYPMLPYMCALCTLEWR